MATLRDIKRKIRSVISTRQITKAMEMVAAARLRKAQLRVAQVRPYYNKMDEALSSLVAASDTVAHPYFLKRPIKKQTLVLITSDRGLCGSFNANLIRRAQEWLEARDPEQVELVLIGRKGFDFFKAARPGIKSTEKIKWPVAEKFYDWDDYLDIRAVRNVVDFLTRRFESGESDEIAIIYTKFISTAKYKVSEMTYLPIEQSSPAAHSANKDYIFEPSPGEIFAELMPRYALTKLISVLAESITSEQGSRMIAMGGATSSAAEVINSLTLQYNKERQAAITKELLETVSGAEALKG
jgi:F-type H+-transporting ATPase subunit gamma